MSWGGRLKSIKKICCFEIFNYLGWRNKNKKNVYEYKITNRLPIRQNTQIGAIYLNGKWEFLFSGFVIMSQRALHSPIVYNIIPNYSYYSWFWIQYV